MTSFTDMVIDGSPVRRDGADLLIPLRLPWYRSLALSTIEGIELSIDGAPIDRGAMRFEVNDHSYCMDEMTRLTEEFWFVQDEAVIRIPAPAQLGATVRVDVLLSQRAPYILVGPDQCMVKRTHRVMDLEVTQA